MARVAGGLSSKISAIQRIDQCTAQQAQDELDRMQSEKAAEAPELTIDDLLNGGTVNQKKEPAGEDGGDTAQQWRPGLMTPDPLSYGTPGWSGVVTDDGRNH